MSPWGRVRIALIALVVSAVSIVGAVMLPPGVLADGATVLAIMIAVATLILTFLGLAEIITGGDQPEESTAPPDETVDAPLPTRRRRAA